MKTYVGASKCVQHESYEGKVLWSDKFGRVFYSAEEKDLTKLVIYSTYVQRVYAFLFDVIRFVGDVIFCQLWPNLGDFFNTTPHFLTKSPLALKTTSITSDVSKILSSDCVHNIMTVAVNRYDVFQRRLTRSLR
ncbi:hypothetical protein GCK32_017460 [Trichostrongylus colubriformis]|uniref:Uncharacterized protein n=1 Tax=Trichostrongylus colubriformis TaxID=6319 RepID=A0AAN8EYS6_TRICO